MGTLAASQAAKGELPDAEALRRPAALEQAAGGIAL